MTELTDISAYWDPQGRVWTYRAVWREADGYFVREVSGVFGEGLPRDAAPDVVWARLAAERESVHDADASGSFTHTRDDVSGEIFWERQ